MGVKNDELTMKSGWTYVPTFTQELKRRSVADPLDLDLAQFSATEGDTYGMATSVTRDRIGGHAEETVNASV